MKHTVLHNCVLSGVKPRYAYIVRVTTKQLKKDAILYIYIYIYFLGYIYTYTIILVEEQTIVY